jgi:O-antigen/teichoic acid export membrane protein
LKKNIAANYLGRFWSFFSAFLFTPLYIHYLGIEGFAIISLALVISGLMSILDAGLSATLSRELALKNTSHSVKVNTFSTFEILYFTICSLVILIVFIFSHQIANDWLNLDKIDPLKVSNYLKIMGIGIAFELLSNFYSGGLMGLEQQVKANFYKIGWGIARNALVVIPLIYSPSLELFFIWQTVTTITYTLLIRRSLINELNTKIPLFRKPTIDKEILKATWKFAGGILLISIVASVNTQMDKLVISKFLPINILGYYMLAASISLVIVSLVTPVSAAMLPRFTALFSERRIREVSLLFSKIFLIVSIVILSFGVNIIFFSKELIWIWTGNINLANSAYQFVPYLTLGTIMLSFQILLYSISLANGYTKINNYLGIVSLIVTVPGYWMMTKNFGAIGAAMTWGFTQALITPFYIYFINKRFFPNPITVHQIFRNFIIPLSIALIVAYLFAQFDYFRGSRLLELFWIGLSTVSSLIVCGLFLFKKSQIRSFFTFASLQKSKNN